MNSARVHVKADRRFQKRCSEKQNNLNFLTDHKSLNCGRDKLKHNQNYIAMVGISVVNWHEGKTETQLKRDSVTRKVFDFGLQAYRLGLN
jgi:hypothetical protein